MAASSSKLGKASTGLGMAAAGVQAIPIFGQILGGILGGVSAGIGGAAAAKARKEREEAEALAREQMNAEVLGTKQGRPAGERIRVGSTSPFKPVFGNGGPGAGISFVPGSWSAIGTAITQEQYPGAENKGVQAAQQGPNAAQASTPAAAPNASRPGQQQSQNNQPQAGPVPAKVFNQPQGFQGDYQSQMHSAIADLILKGDLNDLRGV
jgi:hypothetical protein